MSCYVHLASVDVCEYRSLQHREVTEADFCVCYVSKGCSGMLNETKPYQRGFVFLIFNPNLEDRTLTLEMQASTTSNQCRSSGLLGFPFLF